LHICVPVLTIKTLYCWWLERCVAGAKRSREELKQQDAEDGREREQKQPGALAASACVRMEPLVRGRVCGGRGDCTISTCIAAYAAPAGAQL
jgi:hypothetical protein